MASQDQINEIRDKIIEGELALLIAAATYTQITTAINVAGLEAQTAITIGVNTRDSRKIGDAVLNAVEEYGTPFAETTADNILSDELLSVDEIFKYDI